MKQLFILSALIFVTSPFYAQTEKWYNEEQYDIIRNIDTLQAGGVTFIKRIVNDTVGYYKGACVDVYCNIEDVSSYTYAYPDITLRYYNFDFEDNIKVVFELN
jgi:hypothetical protein